MNVESQPVAQASNFKYLLDIHDLVKSYGGTPALRGVSLQVEAGAIVCLLGPSGCGKTTLLRTIVGLEQPDQGSIVFAGQPIEHVPTHERGFGLMFQDYALFPHRDVASNIAFGLRMQHRSREQIAARVAEMLDLVGLAGYDRRRVYELSGGERQRVALARSLAPSPRLLMLDEPLGALDRALRERLLDELRSILKHVGVTSIYVTHDQAEAFAIADWLVLMNAGQIEQQGPPAAVYQHPATLFSARFLGFSNLIPGRVMTYTSELCIETSLGELYAVDHVTTARSGTAVTVVVPPEAAEPSRDVGGRNVVSGVVLQRSFRGSRTRVTVEHTSGQRLDFDLDGAHLPEIGAQLTLQLRASALSVMLGMEGH